MPLVLFLLAITVIATFLQTKAFVRLWRYVDREMARRPNGYHPYATVILPCKGLDPGFRENVQKLLDQDYPEFEVIFAVAAESDPAYKELVELSARASRKARVVVAGIDSRRAQKINNQLCALEQVTEQTEVLVFVDSDVIARNDFLSRLVEPLREPQVGCTTGYRFYIASLANWPSQLRSLWNRVTAWEMADPGHAFAWGGAMAIKRETFIKAGVAESWDRAADDDLSLTTAVKAINLTVHFVPQCLVASDGNSAVGEIIEWTNRQLILTKVYYPKLWGRAIVRAMVMALWLVAMVGAGLVYAMDRDPVMLNALWAGASLVLVEFIFLVIARRLWQRVLIDNKEYIRESFITSCAAIPVAHMVLPWVTLYSLLTNRIQWRGITYELKSPTETLIISS
ncbi:MAG: glycosyltransferase [Candidatus Obscuribacterales bacterium]|jgi:ceramide glucosyltransferase|nr:glycosyltransferase [Candidatus Obscuribacterales bacterium]